jgi:MtN3 and saliva related transmembrane protein
LSPGLRANLITIIGLIAATLTTASFIPQVIKSWKDKSAKDLSLGMVLIFCSGVILWLVYGILNGDAPLILSNTVTLVLSLTLVILKIRYG